MFSGPNVFLASYGVILVVHTVHRLGGLCPLWMSMFSGTLCYVQVADVEPVGWSERFGPSVFDN